VADLLKSEFGIEADLIPGGVGEFTVWVEGNKIAEKGYDGFPSEAEIVEAIKKL
jgi:predicted Rdx family selenoprotein